MTVIVLFLPLFCALTAGFFGRVIGRKGATLLTTSAMFLNAFVVFTLYYEVCIAGSPITLVLGNWINLGWFDVDFSFSFDSLTVSMLVPVVLISSLVHLFSMGYMSGDPHLPRFFAYLSFFTFAMILLVTADSLLLLFAGWESVGLSSYLLVSFWFTRIQANLAALKAFLMNRFGDWTLTLAVLVVLATVADLSLPTLFSLGTYLNDNLILGLVVLVLIGAIAKSAQMGLHTWLPAAMEGKLKGLDPNLNEYQKEVIIGLLLSDGYVNHNRLSCTFKADHLDFINWLRFEILASICTTAQPTPWPRENPSQYWFCTRTHPYFTYLRNQWYKNKIKILPNHLEKDFTEVSLAFLLMGDGYWSENTVFISTENFTLTEVHYLMKILRNKYGLVLSTKKRGKGFRIRFSSRGNNLRLLRSLVTPHFHPIMMYKLGL